MHLHLCKMSFYYIFQSLGSFFREESVPALICVPLQSFRFGGGHGATWVKNPRFNHRAQRMTPSGLTFAFTGGCGAECLASICDHELSRLGYGVTLDFRSCFDTIDLPLITEALMASLPSGLTWMDQVAPFALDRSEQMDPHQWAQFGDAFEWPHWDTTR